MSRSELSMKDLASESVEGLNNKLLASKKELFNLRFQRALGELKNSSRFRVVKKDVARVKTELARRKLGE